MSDDFRGAGSEMEMLKSKVFPLPALRPPSLSSLPPHVPPLFLLTLLPCPTPFLSFPSPSLVP